MVEFLVLVRGNFFLYHLKAYLNGFILSHDTKFLVMKRLFYGAAKIENSEGVLKTISDSFLLFLG